MSEFCEGCDVVPAGIELFDPGEWEYCPHCGTKLVTMAEHGEALSEERAERDHFYREYERRVAKQVFDLGVALNQIGVRSW